MEKYNLFISKKDLEDDLYNSGIKKNVQAYFDSIDDAEAVALMQKRKATFMYSFLKTNQKLLKKLQKDDLAKPLFACAELIERIHHEAD
jgi:putative ATP-dependent endonuclease of OLD family